MSEDSTEKEMRDIMRALKVQEIQKRGEAEAHVIKEDFRIRSKAENFFDAWATVYGPQLERIAEVLNPKEKEMSEDKTRHPILDSSKTIATQEWVQKTFADFLNQWEDIYFEMMEDIFGDVRDIKKVLGGNRWLTGQLPDELTDWPGCEFPVCSQCNSKAPRDAIRLNLGVNDAIFCRLECLKEWVALFPNVDAPKCSPTRRASPIWSAHLTCTKEKDDE